MSMHILLHNDLINRKNLKTGDTRPATVYEKHWYIRSNTMLSTNCFPEKISARTFLTFGQFPNLSPTAIKFSDISRFSISRQVVNLLLTSVVGWLGFNGVFKQKLGHIAPLK